MFYLSRVGSFLEGQWGFVGSTRVGSPVLCSYFFFEDPCFQRVPRLKSTYKIPCGFRIARQKWWLQVRNQDYHGALWNQMQLKCQGSRKPDLMGNAGKNISSLLENTTNTKKNAENAVRSKPGLGANRRVIQARLDPQQVVSLTKSRVQSEQAANPEWRSRRDISRARSYTEELMETENCQKCNPENKARATETSHELIIQAGVNIRVLFGGPLF